MRADNTLMMSVKSFPWQRALYEWLTIDAPILIYMLKATIAGLTALWISMKLNLPDPRTAIFTVFIVMQPQSGLVFSKSYYRVVGTIVGVGMSLLMMGFFAQDPIWFYRFFLRSGSVFVRRQDLNIAIFNRMDLSWRDIPSVL